MITLIHEHYNGFKEREIFDFEGSLSFEKDYACQFSVNRGNEKLDCFRIWSDRVEEVHYLANSYFVGVDWIVPNKKAIYVEPKLNKDAKQTNYLKMLFSALKHSEVSTHTEGLFEIKWKEEEIEISQQQDLLTPLLVVQFLRLVKEIVRKGLKKSYYRVEENLNCRVKGKVMVSQTIKQNLLKNKALNTFCSYDEFGFNNPENSLLKKALVFVQKYLPTLKNLKTEEFTTEIFNYINPAFYSVSEQADINLVKHTKSNSFYKEYSEAIRLAKLILKRFGYNITNTQQKEVIKTPPFWIDMSLLFELYVLGLLKDSGHSVQYQPKGNYGRPDYLIPKYQMIVDAKYKTFYNQEFSLIGDRIRDIIVADIRQISGYARDKEILRKLDIDDIENSVVECLIIYPELGNSLNMEQANIAVLKEINGKKNIDEFVKFYKLVVEIPVIV